MDRSKQGNGSECLALDRDSEDSRLPHFVAKQKQYVL